MRRRRLLLGGLGALTASFGSSALSQSICFSSYDSTSGDWRRPGDAGVGAEELGSPRLLPVDRRLPEAIGLLAKRSFAALTGVQARRFAAAASGIMPSYKFRPYLVRAVAKQGDPVVVAKWDGHILLVWGMALGCARLVNHPIIVFLERPPEEVFVVSEGPA